RNPHRTRKALTHSRSPNRDHRHQPPWTEHLGAHARMTLTRPDNLKAEHHDHLARLIAACPEMAQLAVVVEDFAKLRTPRAGKADGLSRWIIEVRSVGLPHLRIFARSVNRDRNVVHAALTLPYSNGPADGKAGPLTRTDPTGRLAIKNCSYRGRPHQFLRRRRMAGRHLGTWVIPSRMVRA
ncbi:transposase, partial [Streptomyces sp. NPDC101455]|uniref:transposase n=1 Tax=Streptomyces sp. NPDC101455 TaxID=3366142 RepID=UPI0038159283